jgi:hypothetical protein
LWIFAPKGSNHFGTQSKKGYSFSFEISDEFGEKRLPKQDFYHGETEAI